ncbi:hypothetical protein GE061_012261 [Apolygus lucorum]|uniref:Uncharacterized protein n=1 Tax=Apolygus lucorum TaxID=248454 RepID=A0A8S9XUH7_APOLU|nr:hypothetical protein GE061_012261 [Apolygus lucorum]
MWYLRCSDTKCEATGKMVPMESLTDSTVTLTKEHLHELPTEYTEAVNTLRKTIRERCGSENKDLRIIFDEECNKGNTGLCYMSGESKNPHRNAMWPP